MYYPDYDLYQIPAQAGEKKISIIVETSWRNCPDVCFELYKSGCNWTAYWAFEPSFHDLLSLIERLHLRQPEFKLNEIIARSDFRAAFQASRPVYSHGVDGETGSILLFMVILTGTSERPVPGALRSLF